MALCCLPRVTGYQQCFSANFRLVLYINVSNLGMINYSGTHNVMLLLNISELSSETESYLA